MDRFVYVTYIRGRPDAVWRALTDAEFTRQYWEHDNVSDWRPGSTWEHRRTDASLRGRRHGRGDRVGAAAEAGDHLGVPGRAARAARASRSRSSRSTTW